MAKIRYDGPNQFKPVSGWGLCGYSFLYIIPIIGQIFLIIFALSGKNINRRNHARSYFCYLLVVILVTVILGALMFFGVGKIGESIKKYIPGLSEPVEKVEELIGKITGKSGAQETKAEKPASTVPGVRNEVKEAIDSYEAFFEEYADFMKKYAESGNSATMLTKYLSMMEKYAETMEKWEKFDKEYDDMNAAETAYFEAAAIRIEKTLLEVK